MTAVPRTIWHYTDAAGLFGITTSNVLRLTDVRCLNDRTERKYGLRLVTEALREAIAAPTADEILARADYYIDHNLSETDLYICSFSENAESISQWQRYGAAGSGYCIGFNFATFDERAVAAASVDLRRMQYRAMANRADLVQQVRDLASSYRGVELSGKPSFKSVDTMAAALSVDIEELALGLKNPDFADECEWRLVREVRRRTVDNIFQARFAVRGEYVKPYLEVTFLDPKNGEVLPLPISEILTGPRLDQELAMITVDKLIGTTRHIGIPVEPSALSASWR